MKTIREWLEELPDGISERAIRNAEDRNRDVLGQCACSLSQALRRAFIWYYTEEKVEFWAGVCAKAAGLDDDWPPLPDSKPDPVLERLDRIEAELRRLTELLTAEREKPDEWPESHTPPPRPRREPWMHPLPEGAVLLGRGCSFEVPESGVFEGWVSDIIAPSWDWNSCWSGLTPRFYYAAPADSEIARINGLEGGSQ